jgi:predicted transcriptional regulator
MGGEQYNEEQRKRLVEVYAMEESQRPNIDHLAKELDQIEGGRHVDAADVKKWILNRCYWLNRRAGGKAQEEPDAQKKGQKRGRKKGSNAAAGVAAAAAVRSPAGQESTKRICRREDGSGALMRNGGRGVEGSFKRAKRMRDSRKQKKSMEMLRMRRHARQQKSVKTTGGSVAFLRPKKKKRQREVYNEAQRNRLVEVYAMEESQRPSIDQLANELDQIEGGRHVDAASVKMWISNRYYRQTDLLLSFKQRRSSGSLGGKAGVKAEEESDAQKQGQKRGRKKGSNAAAGVAAAARSPVGESEEYVDI